MNTQPANPLPPVAPGIFTLPPYDGKPPELLGGYCPVCRKHFFPRPAYCTKCIGAVNDATLGSEGVIYSFTVIRTKAPMGLPEPYSVGYIDLAQTKLRVFCLLDPKAIDELRVGLPVLLSVEPLGNDNNGNPCLRPYFSPLKKN